MANFITTSITYEGKSNYKALIAPMFVGKSPFETPGIKIMPNIQTGDFMNLFSRSGKMTKAYAKGWTTPGNISSYTRRAVTTYQMKAEGSQDANEFKQTVFEQLQGKGIDWNDINKAGKVLKDTIMNIWFDGIKSDIFRQFWLNDTNKETVTSGIYTGTADEDYNAYDGMWKTLIDNASTTLNTTNFFRSEFSNAAVAQVDTVTLTGSSGTCNVTFNGVAYLATFGTNLTVTTAAFVTSHATALALRGVTVTSSSDDIIFTSSIAGQPFTAVTISAAVSGNLTGSRAATTPNTAPAALASDEAIGKLKALYTGVNATLKEIPVNQKAFLVTDTVYENYLETLEGKSATALTWTSEDGRKMLINGATVLQYRGIPVIKMGWDTHLNADFPTGYPHRIIYTELNNLVLPIDAKGDFSRTEAWYSQDNQENRFRTQFRAGADYVWAPLTAIAY